MINKKEAFIIVGISLICICIIYCKLPRELISYFDLGEPVDASLILYVGNEVPTEIFIDDAQSIKPLWEALENTRVSYLGKYDIMSYDVVYYVGVRMVQEGHTSNIFFRINSDGYVFIDDKEYALYGTQEILSILAGYFNR